MKSYSIFTLCLLLSFQLRSAIIYVKSNASGSNNGSSWANAYTGLQAGITAASSGDQVWVAAGTYGHSIAMKEGVQIYGGFNGTETLLSQRNWTTNICEIIGGGSINQPCILNISNALTNNAVLDGFYIQIEPDPVRRRKLVTIELERLGLSVAAVGA